MVKRIALIASLMIPAAFHIDASGLLMQDFVNQQAAEQAMRERRLAPLTAAGIDTNSTDALIRALRHKQVPVQLAAIYLLKERKATAALPDLRSLLTDPASPPLTSLNVCDALADLETSNPTWKGPCLTLLDPRHDSMTRIRAAGVFAKHGDPSGWDQVRESLLSSQQGDVEEAAMVAPYFDGLTQVAGSRRTTINVFAVCAGAFNDASAPAQLNLVAVIGKAAKKADAGAVADLAAHAKSPYAKSSLDSIAKTLTAK